MSIWRNCKASIFYSDGTATEHNRNYQVRIEGDFIVVSYESNGNHTNTWVSYEGNDVGHGHYKLIAKHKNDGFATLHIMPDDDFLEGYWTQENQTGMWRIELIL